MGSFNTTSGFPDLVGTCEIDPHNQCYTYHSDTRGDATEIKNLGGPMNVKFSVRFSGVPQKYVITAPQSGPPYSGSAKDRDDTEIDEPWAATATGEPAVAAKGSK